eukprot:15232416-Alexandrium_andersonii.AAC.1
MCIRDRARGVAVTPVVDITVTSVVRTDQAAMPPAVARTRSRRARSVTLVMNEVIGVRTALGLAIRTPALRPPRTCLLYTSPSPRD